MKNPLKKKQQEFTLGDASSVLNSGAAAGIAIASFTGKKKNIGGMIGGGMSLLLTGLILMLDDETKK
jgi:hypothetical protein